MLLCCKKRNTSNKKYHAIYYISDLKNKLKKMSKRIELAMLHIILQQSKRLSVR